MDWLENIIGKDGSAPSPIEVATHEAAHAVIAIHLGYRVAWVLIEPDAARGEMTLDGSWQPPTPHQRLLIAQAGSAAQCKMNNMEADWTFEGTTDRLQADDLAEEFGLNIGDFTQIHDLLCRQEIWERVTKLAAVLIVSNRIDFPDLDLL